MFSLSQSPSVYKWTGINNFFVISNSSCVAMGGGDGGFALQIGACVFVRVCIKIHLLSINMYGTKSELMGLCVCLD